MDSNDNRQWLLEFEKRTGRRLRVLHIGNIANNAYNNAKIQRERGIDADVLSFDYYHCMASPEWEDAEFVGGIKDDFFPDWWAVDLKGFRRPRWFAAGPLDGCIRYLLAKTADRRSSYWLWLMLNFERWLLSRRSGVRNSVHAALKRFTGAAVTYQTAPANALMMTSLGRKLEAISRHRFIRDAPAGRWLRWRALRLRRFGRTADLANDGQRHLRMMQRNVADIRRRSEALFKDIGRKDVPDELEFFYAWWWHPYLTLLFRRYDVIQCYATYTALPFVAGVRSYVAYEHGTIRSIPFEPTREGRMCMASYRAASAVLITNLDNLEAAEKMQLDPQRVTCLPHAFDSDKLIRFAEASGRRQPAADKVTTFVTPARQHWVDNDPGWAKGNDRVFAALRILKDKGRPCILRAVAWGNDIEASRTRIAELGIEEMVQWMPKKKKAELWLEYLDAHAVIDQFVVPAFGGITFEAMMLGRRVITNIDEARARQFFGAAPPLFSCESAEEIAEAMARIIDDPSDAGDGGHANQAWMMQYHSADRIVSLQTDVYRRLVEGEALCPNRPEAMPPRRHDRGAMPKRDWLKALRPFYVKESWQRTTTGNEIVMLVVSALRIDPRVEREARALAACDWHVRIVAPDISSPSFSERPIDWGRNVTFHLLPFASAQYVMEAPWLVAEDMYRAAVSFTPFAYHCHDLNTALIGMRAAREVGARCVCDFHEWSSENVTWNNERALWEPHEPPKRTLFRWAERLALRRADKVITVNASIARELDKLARSPQRRVKVIRNIPSLSACPTRAYPPLKEQLRLPADSFVVLYQGGTGPTRLLEPVIQALALAPKAMLVIRGPSLDLFGDGYRQVARKADVEDRLVLADAVPSRDVVVAAQGADVGLWTLPNLSRNFYLALPNKIFEYLAAGLPLLVAHFPEAKRIADEGCVGLCFDPYDPASIAAQINRFADDADFATRCRAAVPAALVALDAKAEWDRLVELYDQLRESSPLPTQPAYG